MYVSIPMGRIINVYIEMGITKHTKSNPIRFINKRYRMPMCNGAGGGGDDDATLTRAFTLYSSFQMHANIFDLKTIYYYLWITWIPHLSIPFWLSLYWLKKNFHLRK